MSRPSRMSRRRLVLAVAAAVSATACSGPDAPLNVGMNTRPVELLLGQRIKVVTEGIAPPMSPSFAPTGYLDEPGGTGTAPELLRRPKTVPGPGTPVACRTAPPDAGILTLATPSPPGPPSPATYTYRVKGAVTVAGHTRALPEQFTRDLANVRAEPPAAHTFDAFDSMGSESSVTSYRLVPEWHPVPTSTTDVAENAAETQTGQEVPGAPAGSRVQPGLYITRLAASDTGFRAADPGIKLVEFPVVPRATFTTAASDGVTTMTYTSTVNPVPARVDACGVLLDVHQVDLTGEISRSTENEGYVRARFAASYGVATQYGGLVAWEKVEISSEEVSRTLEATINQEPARPQTSEGQG